MWLRFLFWPLRKLLILSTLISEIEEKKFNVVLLRTAQAEEDAKKEEADSSKGEGYGRCQEKYS